MVSSASNVVEIEADSATNTDLMFLPLERRVRGRLDFHRIAEPKAGEFYKEWPQPIPGQRIRLDLTAAEGVIVEPLRHDEHLLAREKLEKKGHRIPPECERFGGVDTATWLYWMRRAVDAGYAKVVAGRLPEADQIEGRPRKDFFFHRAEVNGNSVADAMNNVAKAMEANTKVMAEVLKTLKHN